MKSGPGQISGTGVLELLAGLDAIMGDAPIPMAATEGEKHSLCYVNPAFCRLLGKSRAELVGRPFPETVPVGDSCLRLLERVYRTGEAETYTENGQAASHPFFGAYMMWPVLDGLSGRQGTNNSGKEHPIGVMIQVTESLSENRQTAAMNENLMLSIVRQHELADAAEKKLQGRLQFLAESMPQKMFTAKPSGEIDYFNEEWMEYTGLTLDEMRGWGWVEFVHPDDIDENMRVWRYSIETGSPFLFEQRFRNAEGAYRWHLSRARPMRDEHGEIVIWVGTNTDIEDSKKAQEALLRVEKLAAAGRLAASIAHEINNPLEAVTNVLYLARMAEGVPPDSKEYLEIADRELMRIAHITRQTLGFYREQSEPSAFFVSGLLNSVVEVMGAKIKAKNVQIELRCDEVLRMTGVFGEIRQVFANLLLNSLDAVENGGCVRLRGSCCSQYGVIRITVADNGSGIAADTRTHIFEPFFTTKQKIGTGLGLWVSKQIVEKHGGTIRVRSNLAGMWRGTAFSVVLPVAE